jgi:hypothetical protein
MKKMMKLLLTATIAVFLFSTITYGQTSTKEITFTVKKTGDKLFTKNSSGLKTFEFTMSGLTTQAEIDAFTVKFNKIRGVEKFTATLTTDNTWDGSVTFSVKTSRSFLKKVLIEAGVSKIVVGGKTIITSEWDTSSSKSKSK